MATISEIRARRTAVPQLERIAPMMTTHIDWRQNALAAAKKELTPGERYTGEAIRNTVSIFVGSPSHPNCWGSFILRLVKEGWLQPTGDTSAMEEPTSHGRRTPVYTFHQVA